MTKPLLLLLAMVTLFAVLPPGTALLPNQPNINYGVVISPVWLTKPDDKLPSGSILDLLRDTSSTTPKTTLDVGAIRTDIFWYELQPNSTTTPNVPTQLQDVIHKAIVRKLHVFVTLSGTPAWAGPCPECKPTNMTAWTNFVSQVLTTFQADLANMTFGIWNEPNIHGFTPADYRDLYNAANSARTGTTAAARFAVPDSEAGAVNINSAGPGLSWLASTLSLLALHASDVITVHWYPGNRSQDLSIYMQKVLSTVGNRETWLSELGELKENDYEQQTTLGNYLDVFNHRPSAQWSKIFIYRFYGGDYYDLMRVSMNRDYVGQFRGRESFYTFHRKIRTWSVSLKADNNKFVSAPDDGSGNVLANATTAGLGETFILEDLDGEGLLDGDIVTLLAPGGMNLRATGTLHLISAVADCECTDYDRFIVEAGTAGTGFRVAFRSQASGKYVSLESLTSKLFASASAPAAASTFQLTVR